VGAGDGTWPGHSLAAANNAGNRCRVVWVAVGRSGDELVGEVEPSQRVHRGHLKGVVQVKIGKQARNTLREHGLADARRAMEEHVMPTGDGHLAGPLRFGLTDHIRQVQTTVRMPAGTLSYDLDGVNRRYRGAAQKATNWAIEAIPKTPMPSTSFASPACRSGTITLAKPACRATKGGPPPGLGGQGRQRGSPFSSWQCQLELAQYSIDLAPRRAVIRGCLRVECA
jgi:hypothetical protein